MLSQVFASTLLVALPTMLQSPQTMTSLNFCADTIKNQVGNPPCLDASTFPTLGSLFPISKEWYIGPSGEVGIGTITPSHDFEISGPTNGSDIVLSLKGSCPNATILELDNTDPVGHNYALGSWGTLAGAGVLQGKFSIFDVTAGVHRLVIDANGNVGIGASVYSPSTALEVTGTITGAVKNFRIDHPLDPENKTLEHSCIESSEMLDLYRGNVTLDDNGAAVVALPDWFEALNKEFSYQLTPLGKPAPGLYIAQEIEKCQFKIAGGTRGARVSWLVTGVRHDAYASSHPLEVERDKGVMCGTLLYPKEQKQQAELAQRK